MGVATANSVLVISFARERYAELGDPRAATLEAGFVRIRPVLMTALAMIIGMLPMALGLGEGGEQNAPLGRAVIGGLMFSTVATLMFVPVVFSLVHKKQEPASAGLVARRAARAGRRVTAKSKPRKRPQRKRQGRDIEGAEGGNAREKQMPRLEHLTKSTFSPRLSVWVSPFKFEASQEPSQPKE
jgi:predicted RND superfamily exporter protein